jgi:hypothetical protein
MRGRRIIWIAISLLSCLPLSGFAAVSKADFASKFPSASPLGKLIGSDADAALDTAAGGDWRAGVMQANQAFQLAISYGSTAEIDAFREAAYTKRLLDQLQPLDASVRAELLGYLRAHDELGHTIVFAVREGNNVKGVYHVLTLLRQQRESQIEQFPTLAAALCVVRDRPVKNPVEKTAAPASSPLDLFDFYSTHESKMFFGIRRIPVDLLVYVVDSPASIDEMNWALAKYAGTQNVGDLFFKIAYDYDFFEGKTPERHVVMEGYSLPNILKFGGICADQSYFATSVGKAIGVPTAYTVGVSAEMGHAWVGFLQMQGHTARWNFNSGRYEEYQGVRGNVADPQSNKRIADSYVSLLAESIGASATARENAIALVDAARRLANGKPFETPPLPDHVSSSLSTARTANSTSELDLIEMGLRQCPAYSNGWQLVANLAQQEQLSEAQKSRWAGLVQRLCGDKYPDFTLAVLEPMVATVHDPIEQNNLWEATFKMFVNRADLAAEVRMHQAALWESNNNLPRAGQCYEDVIQRFINSGPFALAAVKGAESVLVKMGQQSKVLELYDNATKLVEKPQEQMATEFFKESNWYKLREAYAAKLSDAGRTQEADKIRAADVPVGSS